ncbi:MAG: aldehyde ferredoxin oxidoreductase family protein [Eubacteriales bacterium]|nr:aldehyde ferredoxin oxidoreductase family protein [Eubacteriales bacterium]
MSTSFMNCVIRVDLKTGKISKEPLNMQFAKDYIGARGLGTKYHITECKANIDPLGPDNKLIFMTGPLTGTFSPCSGRYEVVAKAPLTGTIGAANSGGHFGPELKYAGYDGIIFENQASKPVYLLIEDDKVELRDASDLWGKTVFETTDILNERHGETARVACIGPTGERLVLYSGVMNDKHRAAGRGGLGAVMGSKKLKAVVVKGTGSVEHALPKEFMDACINARQVLKAHPVTGAGLGAYGTQILVNIINGSDAMPVNNWKDGSHFDKGEDISGEALVDKYLVRNKGCFGCCIGCGRVTKIKEGPFKSFGEGPEYEAGWSFGADCGVSDLAAVCKANFICNEYGFDPITLGSTIACAMELFEMGAIKESEIGFPLRFGDAVAMVKAAEITGKGEGFGKILGEGSYRLATKYGHPELSMSVKKQEMPAYDGRCMQGIGLEYATSNRGGCHVRGYMTSPEILGIPIKVDPLTTEGKAPLLKTFQDLTAAFDSAGICLFTSFGIGLKELCELYRAAVGSNESDEEILLKGERTWNLEKLYNIEAGVEKDTLPPRLLREALPSGQAKGNVNQLDVMLKEYYEVRGWDKEGIPGDKKKKELNIG